jgi:hypothetical protein
MFWHESNDNDVNIIPYNKADFLKLSNLKNKKESKEKSHTLDLSDQFQVDAIVSTDWGPGRVISVDKINKKVRVKIEGEEQVFNWFEVRTSAQVNVFIYFKNLDLQDKTNIFMTNLSSGETVLDVKKKISKYMGVSTDNVILVHNFLKLTRNDQKLSELGYSNNLLAIINGVCDYS